MLRDQGDNAINDSVSPHCVPRSHECDILFSFHRGIPSSRGTQMKNETGEREISLRAKLFSVVRFTTCSLAAVRFIRFMFRGHGTRSAMCLGLFFLTSQLLKGTQVA